jgi:hypothetical protein
MKAMARRLDDLESAKGTELSPAGKAWLGRALTPNEQRGLDAELRGDCAVPDLASFTPEAQRWLQR